MLHAAAAQQQQVKSESELSRVSLSCVLVGFATLSVRRRGVTCGCIVVCSSALDTSHSLSKGSIFSFPDAPMSQPSTSAPNTTTNTKEVVFAASFFWLPPQQFTSCSPSCLLAIFWKGGALDDLSAIFNFWSPVRFLKRDGSSLGSSCCSMLAT